MRTALSGLTTRGRCLLAAGFAAGACAVVLNERDLLRVAAFVIALPLLAAWLATRARVGLHAARFLAPSRVPVGAASEVKLDLRSTGRLPTGGLMLEDTVPYALGARPRFLVERLPRNTPTTLRYPLKPVMRGIQQVGPLMARITDPFGLAEFERELAHTSRLVVVPRVVRLFGVPGGSGLGSGDDGSVRLAAGQGEDDAIVRPYRQGDDLRKVHWRSTAKRDEMMVRVEERPWRGGTTVLLDHRGAAHRGAGTTASLEWAVSFAASICLHLHRYGQRIRLVTESGRMIVSDTGDGSHNDNAVLDALASLQATPQREIDSRTDPGHGQELIAILGATSPESLSQLVGQRSRGTRSLAVLLDTEAWGPSPDEGTPGAVDNDIDGATALLRGAGWGVTVARPNIPMTATWSTLCRTHGTRHHDLTTGVGQ
jgi:uncharacterized protein (DUF58 family)